MSAAQKPIELEEFRQAIKELPDDTVVATRNQITNSLEKLLETQQILKAEIAAIKANESKSLQSSVEEDLRIYQESYDENTIVIANQNERLKLIDDELVVRGFKDVHIDDNKAGVVDL